jgi:NAD(P)-dependent dehydrogenase (short-subunit alcohol dehydrogenase family)
MQGSIFSLANKTAIVTGAAGLLGRQHCWALAEAGANVVATDLRGDACQALAAELSRLSVSASGLQVDVTSPSSLRALRDVALKHFDHIDILVNNAAIDDVFHDAQGTAVAFEQYPLKSWQQAMDVNLTGAFLCSQIIGAEMAGRGTGSIINIASTYGIVAPDQSLYRRPDGSQAFYKSAAYPVAKAGLLALTRYLAAYWGAAGIRVNALSPGGVENSQDDSFISNYAARTPMQRMARPTDYKGAIVFLASDASSYMTGANLVIDGGWTIW